MKPPYAPNTVNQTVDYGGVTWKGQPGGGWTAQSATGGGAIGGGQSQDPVAQMKAIQQFQVEQNQPAIQTLQGAKTDLATQYKTLLDSIKGAEQPALDVANAQGNAANAARGILPESELALKNIAGIENPIASQFGQLTAQTGLGQQQDLNTLAQQIASLQAGNVPQAVQGGGQFAGLAQQAALLPSQIGLNQAQAGQVGGQNATQLALARIGQQYQPVNPGQFLLNTANNSYVNPSQLMQQLGYAAGNFGAPVTH